MADLICPVFRQALEKPDAVAIESGNKKINYLELHNLAEYLHCLFAEQGVNKGDVLAAVAANSFEAIVLAIACWRKGVIFAPFNPRWRAHQIGEQLHNMQPDWLWIDDALSQRIASGEYKRFHYKLPMNLSIPARLLSTVTAPDTDCPIDLIQTSGSLGRPKFVAHSLRNHLANASAASKIIALDSNDAWLLSLPLHHIAGLAIIIRCFVAGARVLLVNNRENWLEFIFNGAVSHLSLVATQLWQLLDSQCQQKTRLKAVLLGGGPINPELIAKAGNAGFHCFSSYGMTEASSQIYTIDHGKPNHGHEGVNPGGFLEGFDVRCDDRKQLLIKGKALALGYWKNGELVDFRDHDGWFATGDLGSLANGGLSIVGRKDNVFICGGENLQPEKIEKAIKSYPGIRQVLVVPVDDQKWGKIPVAFIDGISLDDKKLVSWLDSYLNGLERPRAFFPWRYVIITNNKVNRVASAKIAAKLTNKLDSKL